MGGRNLLTLVVEKQPHAKNIFKFRISLCYVPLYLGMTSHSDHRSRLHAGSEVGEQDGRPASHC